MPAAYGPAPAGQRLGRYRLAQRIGEGGMGVVHLGIDERGTAVAVKVLRPHIAGDPEARRRLGREVDSLRRVRHPRVAEVLDADTGGETPYVVTQFVPGMALDDHVRQHGPLSGVALARLGNGLGEALAAIHLAGIVHRDLKPGNVLMLDGDPVVIDFGIAHVADDVRLTSTGLIMGTPGYLSPELVEGEPVAQATDWWGWAATMTFAATGRPPFGRGPMEVVLDRVRRGVPDLEGVPAVLVPVLAAALAVDPARRPQPSLLRRAVAELEAVSRREEESVVRAGANDGPPGAVPPPDDATQVLPGVQTAGEIRDGAAPDHAAATQFVRTAAEQLHEPQPEATQALPVAAAERTTAVQPTAAVGAPAVPSTLAMPPSTRSSSPPDDARTTPVPTALGAGTPAAPAAAGSAARPPLAAQAYAGAPPPPAPRGASVAPVRYPQPGVHRPLPTPVDGQRVVVPTGRPGPVAQPPVGWPPSQGPASTARPGGQAPPLPAPSAPPRRPRHSGVIASYAVALAAVAAILPLLAAAAGVASLVVARTVDRTAGALHRRRYERGSRRSDGVLTLASSPWHLVMATLVSVPAVILPLLVGASVAFVVGLASPTGPAPGESIPLFAGVLAAALIAWGGPGGGSVRRGSRAIARGVAPGQTVPKVLVALLIGAAVGAGLVAVSRDWQPDWRPLQQAPLTAGTFSGTAPS